MAVYKGNIKQKELYIGSTKIGKVYKGSTLLYSSKIPTGTMIFESATAGTYTINITKPQNYYIELVGGGGGGKSLGTVPATLYGGGSGAYVYGTMYLEKGNYTLNIGNAGINGKGTVGATNGGDTSFNYQIAGGGSRGGSGGTYTTILTGVSGNSGGGSRKADSVYNNSATGYGAGGYGYTARGAVAGYAKIVAA